MKKNLNCILAFAPIACLLVGMVLSIASSIIGSIGGEGFLVIIGVIGSLLGFVLVFAGVIVCLGMIVYFGILVCKRKDLEVGMKVLWCVILYFLNIFAFPVCYFVVLRKAQ